MAANNGFSNPRSGRSRNKHGYMPRQTGDTNGQTNKSSSSNVQNAWKGGNSNRGKTNFRGERRGVSGGRGSSKDKEIVTVSKKTLEKVEKIKQSSVSAFLSREGVESSDSSGEEEEEGDKGREKDLLAKTLGKYYLSLATDDIPESQKEAVISSPEFLSSSFLAASSTCLICICSIRRNHPVWSCNKCYCLFHLQCIHQWVVEGAQRKSLLSPQLFPNQEEVWSCPKCRGEYGRSQCPQTYLCYCGKTHDPPLDPWLLPHSCGEPCDKQLVPECGHYCLSLCHPGPCPPCPKSVSVKCHCGRSQPTMRRCGSKGWSCGNTCRKLLNCGQHICEEKCHEGGCGPCTYMLEQPCQCGRVTKERLCTELDWTCGQKCKKPYSCGHHVCERVCHSGVCGACPRSGERACPCGRTRHTLQCTKEVPTCGDTCGKILSCGLHKCMRGCHHGQCGNCLEQVVKKCRCGNKTKSLNCGTEFLCDVKCTNIKRCGRHPCKRKCCDGNCPPCDLSCGKQLQCGRHKCTAPCHTGRCYPCVFMTTLSCNCGKTRVQVPCEQRQQTRLPKCRELCSTPPTCHHPSRTSHLCHRKECPPCIQECGKGLTCGHHCPVDCHSEPKHRPQEDAPMDATIPWAKMKTILQEFAEQVIVVPCPDCIVPVERACIGEHEVRTFSCVQLKDFACSGICGRRLSCGNHVCQSGCHKVIEPPDATQAGSNCSSCELLCQKQRPQGCTHKCHLECHPDDCPKCEIYLRFRCHCTTMPLFIKCHEWTSANDQQRSQLRACNSQCIKILSCGHRCSFNCHPDECSSINDCTHNVNFHCGCKRIKKHGQCNQKKELQPVCDSECERIKQEKLMEQERIRAEKAAEVERKEREEKEAFRRQLEGRQKKKRKRREKVTEEAREEGFLTRNKKLLLVGVMTFVVLLIALLMVYS